MDDVGHAARLLGLLRLTVEELDEASAALLEDVREQKLPFEESLRLAQLVHLRIETFHSLARTTVDRLGGPPELADLFRLDRDFHVRLRRRRHCDDGQHPRRLGRRTDRARRRRARSARAADAAGGGRPP